MSEVRKFSALISISRELDLHSADADGECVGCEYSGYEAEPPGWPCATVTTVAEAACVTLLLIAHWPRRRLSVSRLLSVAGT